MNNKKLLMVGLPLLAVVLVSAVIIYYSVTINVTANITEPFVTTIVPLSFSGIATNEITEDITIENQADATLPATITWTPRNLDISYNMKITKLTDDELVEEVLDIDLSDNLGHEVLIPNGVNIITLTFSTPEAITEGTLHLTQKNLNDWIPIENGLTADIEYTKIGSVFSATGVLPDGYTLVYYPDTVEGYTGIVYLVEGNDINLPIEEDLNGDEETSTYCSILNDNGKLANPGVTICKGGKLWAVPDGTLTDNEDGSYTIDWADAGDFLFETGLITYTKVTSNSIGTITVERREA